MGEKDVPQKSENRFNFKPQQMASVGAVGLRILIEISQRKSNFLLVKKPTLKLKTKPTFPRNRIHNSHHPSFSLESNSFLKSCFLCTKELSLDKDVYMYNRGDQGFCSVECRDRQIYLDEIKEMEESTKKMAANYRQCRRTSDRGETRALLEQFRQRHKPLPGPKDRPIVLFT